MHEKKGISKTSYDKKQITDFIRKNNGNGVGKHSPFVFRFTTQLLNEKFIYELCY